MNCTLSAVVVASMGFVGLTGCAHPFLKAGADLATAIQKGDSAVSTLVDAEANTRRIYQSVQPTVSSFNVNQASDLDGKFVAEACQPDATKLVAEHVALDNLDKFRAAVETNATDPKDQSLGALFASLTSPATTFQPTNPDKATTEYQKKKDADLAACTKAVRQVFVAQPPAGALTAAVLLAAWPKVKDFLTTLLAQANAKQREDAILAMLNSKDDQTILDQALSALQTSATSGELGQIAIEQKQLALWSAYAEYLLISAVNKPVFLNSTPRARCDLPGADFDALDPMAKSNVCVRQHFVLVNDAANRMAADFKLYDSLAPVDLPKAVQTMTDALTQLRQAAATGKAPGDSVWKELLAAIEFLSDASSKYQDAAGAFKTSKK